MNGLERWIRVAALTASAAGMLAFAAPAQATHVDCGDVITADTTLDSDLIDCPDSGLYIGAAGVTLDLGGHLVDGNGLGAAGIDDIAGHDDVTIRNGIAQGFSQGVSLHGASGGLLDDLERRGNGNGGRRRPGQLGVAIGTAGEHRQHARADDNNFLHR